MTFGQKKPYQVPDIEDIDENYPGFAPKKSSNTEFVLLAGAIFAFTSLLLVFVLAPSSGGGQPALASTNHMFTEDPAPVARDYDSERPASAFGIGTVGSKYLVSFRMVTTKTGFDPIDSELHEKCLRDLDKEMAQFAEAEGKTYLSATTAADFIGCTMTMYTRRFCEPSYRKRLVNRLIHYGLVRRATIKNNKTALGQAYNHVLKNIEQSFDDVDTGVSRNPAIIPVTLRDGLRTLTERGILRASDFGKIVGPPEAFRPFILEPKHDACNRDNVSWTDWLMGRN